jgi:SAM-dependent methyltransferase
MLLRFARDQYASDVAPRLLAAPAELLLDALPPLQPQTRFLEICAGAGPVAKPLVDRIAGLGRLVAVERDRSLCEHLPHAAGRAARVLAGPERLPFATGAFDVCLGNLVLGDPGEDGERLAELRRVLRPGGWLLVTVLLRGSFDEVFDVVMEACEADGLVEERQLLAEARAGFFDEQGARRAFEEAGLNVAHVGVEERGLFFPSGKAAFDDVLIKDVLVASWLQGRALPAAAWERAVGALDAYFGKGRFAVRIRTAVITGRPRAA